MKLAEKMFSRSDMRCPLRSDCREESDRRYFGSLFERDWEVFVIKQDRRTGTHNWFTLCCETAKINDESNINAAAGC